ncbi:MAG: hypothetical protein Q9178_006717 [Gyalolechia marmorata]
METTYPQEGDLAQGPTIGALLFGLPRELRDQILGYLVPSRQTVNLSQLPPFYDRWTWKAGRQRRCGPPLLCVNKQFYEESCDILYRCNFIIDVHCGIVHDRLHQFRNHRQWYDVHRPAKYDKTWRTTNLTGRFPFHRAKEVTVRIQVATGWGCDGPDHLYHHMVYICGLLFSEAKWIRMLRIEILAEPSIFHLDSGCQSWHDTGNPRIAEQGLSEHAQFKNRLEYISFLLKPLALPGRVQNCEITVSDDIETTPEFRDTLKYYKEALTDQNPIGFEESREVWEEYVRILDWTEQAKKERQRLKKERHEEWLLATHKRFDCLHPSRGKRHYHIFRNRMYCEGCERWLRWMSDCRRCDLRSCARCRAELKEKRPALEAIAPREAERENDGLSHFPAAPDETSWFTGVKSFLVWMAQLFPGLE